MGCTVTNHTPRLGFLGLGWIGRNRLEALVQSGAAEIAALCEPSVEATRAALQLAPKALVASSFAHLLEQKLDGLVIATPSALHAEQTLAALERGIPVFCQKPLGRDSREVTQIVALAKQQDCLLGVDLSYRRTRAAEALASQLRSGAIGQVIAINLVFHNAYGPDKDWFYDAQRSGGGALMDLGIHLVDLALWALDFPEVHDVSSRLFHAGHPIVRNGTQVEDYAAAQFTLGQGAVVQLSCSWRLHAGRDCVIAAEFFGTEGGVSLRNQAGSFYDFQTEAFSGTRTQVLVSPPDTWGGRVLVDWTQQLGRDRHFDASAEHLIDVARLIDRIYDNAKTNKP
jgi:predicted dehydrogenase